MPETNGIGFNGIERKQPKMIVFDLDYTLWPFWVDRKMNVEPPFSRTPDGKVFDAGSREMRPFPDTDHILKKLKDDGYKLAAASEAFDKDNVRRLVKFFGWNEFFEYIEIYPGSKITHFLQIKRESGIDFPEMMFFDDERDHLSEVAQTCLGVTCIWANRGVSEEILDEGFKAFNNNHLANLTSSALSINSDDSEESQSDTTVFYVHKRRGSRASIQFEAPPVIDRAVRLRGRRMSAPVLSIPASLLKDRNIMECPEINEN